MRIMRWVLFDGQTSNGNSDSLTLPPESESGSYAITVSGTLGGGTVVLERYDPQSEAWVTHGSGSGSAASWTAAVDTMIWLTRGSYRAGLSGSSGASVHVEIRGGS